MYIAKHREIRGDLHNANYTFEQVKTNITFPSPRSIDADFEGERISFASSSNGFERVNTKRGDKMARFSILNHEKSI